MHSGESRHPRLPFCLVLVRVARTHITHPYFAIALHPTVASPPYLCIVGLRPMDTDYTTAAIVFCFSDDLLLTSCIMMSFTTVPDSTN